MPVCEGGWVWYIGDLVIVLGGSCCQTKDIKLTSKVGLESTGIPVSEIFGMSYGQRSWVNRVLSTNMTCPTRGLLEFSSDLQLLDSRQRSKVNTTTCVQSPTWRQRETRPTIGYKCVNNSLTALIPLLENKLFWNKCLTTATSSPSVPCHQFVCGRG